MAAPPEVRIPIENETYMKVFQPALGESLDAIPDGVRIVQHGFANVGNCDSYYLITHGAVYYCEQERAGLMKKHYVSRITDISDVENLDAETRPGSAYLRFLDSRGHVLLNMWFKDELSAFRQMSAEEELMRFAQEFGS